MKMVIKRPLGMSEEEYRDLNLENVLETHHSKVLAENECSSLMVQRINAPANLVWSVVRRFEKPQAYKRFVRSCCMRNADVNVGSVREIKLISGLPAKSSTERLEILDNEERVFGFRVIGGEHRLRNYRSVTTLTESVKNGRANTLVLQSYVSEIPEGNTVEDTCVFIETVIRCNLQSLAQVTEHLAKTQEEKSILPVPVPRPNPNFTH